MVLRQAAKLTSSTEFKALPDDQARVAWIYQLFRRAPATEEREGAVEFIASAAPADYAPRLAAIEVRHGPETGGPTEDLSTFPMAKDKV